MDLQRAFVTIVSNRMYLDEDWIDSIDLPEEYRGFERKVLIETAKNWAVSKGLIPHDTDVVGLML